MPSLQVESKFLSAKGLSDLKPFYGKVRHMTHQSICLDRRYLRADSYIQITEIACGCCYKGLATGYGLLASGYWLLATGY